MGIIYAVIAELHRLRALGVSNWSNIAVLSREHTDLAQVRTLAELESIPIRWVAGRSAMPALHQVREISRFISEVARERGGFKRASALREIAAKFSGASECNPWMQFLHRMLEAWERESGNAELPVQEALEFMYEACAESRREFSYGDGVTLATVHAAKGTEHDHVLLIGPWRLPSSRALHEEERRTFYVGLTRARKTLAVFDRTHARPSFPQQIGGRGTIRHQSAAQPANGPVGWLNYQVLSLQDIHLGYAGQFDQHHPIHGALAALKPQDRLTLQPAHGNGVGFFNETQTCVARLSRSAQEKWASKDTSVREVRVLAMIQRSSKQDPEENRREHYRVENWEIPLVEIVYSA